MMSDKQFFAALLSGGDHAKAQALLDEAELAALIAATKKHAHLHKAEASGDGLTISFAGVELYRIGRDQLREACGLE